MASTNIKTKTARQQLAHKKNPYWHLVSTGLAVGYSVPAAAGEGSWHIRVGLKTNCYAIERIPASIFVLHPSKDTKFEQACDYARANLDRIKYGHGHQKQDVSAIADAYLAAKQRQDATRPEKTRRLSSFINSQIKKRPLGGVLVSRLSRLDIEAWLKELVPEDRRADEERHRQACETANRGLRQLKAILNWAHSNKLIATNEAWSQIKMFAGVSASRTYIPSGNDFEVVYAAASDVLKDLMLILAETGMRPGEPLRLRVRDFDAQTRMVRIPEETKTGKRTIKVSMRAAEVLQVASRCKTTDMFILGDGDHPLNSCAMSRAMKRLVSRLGVSSEFVLYTIRHAWVTNAIKQSSPMEVAKYAGTSMQMIEKFYLKFDSEHFIDSLDAVYGGRAA